MKILVIMLYWYPYEGPLMPIYGAIFKELMTRGHKVTIVSSFPHFRKGRSETWDEYRGKLFEVIRWEKAKLIRSYVFAPVFDQDKPGLMFRALNFISFNISCVISAILAGGKADIIFAPSSPPLTNGICAWIVSLFKHCPVIYNVQDMYPDMAEKMGIVKSGILLGAMKIIERIVYRICDKVLLLSEGMRGNIIGKGVSSKKTEVIPNFIDSEYIAPFPNENRFSKRWGLNDRFVVMYAGNIGLPHGTEIIIEAADILRSNPDILFCFVGRGEKRSVIEKLVQEKELKNVRFVPPQPEEDVPYIWASADISLVTYRKGLADCSVPSKLLAIMSSGRPAIIMADSDSEATAMVQRSECGLHVPPEDPYALVEAIQFLCSRPKIRSKMGQKGREWVKLHYNKSSIVAQYEKLFASITVQEHNDSMRAN